MQHTRDTLWTITLPFPRPHRAAMRRVLRVALFSLSLGANIGAFAGLARGAEPPTDCDTYASLHYAMSGELDSAWEDAAAACGRREGTLAQALDWAGQCTTPTSWALYLPETDTWRAECGDADGNAVGAP